jgi:hypothetical protein
MNGQSPADRIVFSGPHHPGTDRRAKVKICLRQDRCITQTGKWMNNAPGPSFFVGPDLLCLDAAPSLDGSHAGLKLHMVCW